MIWPSSNEPVPSYSLDRRLYRQSCFIRKVINERDSPIGGPPIFWMIITLFLPLLHASDLTFDVSILTQVFFLSFFKPSELV